MKGKYPDFNTISSEHRNMGPYRCQANIGLDNGLVPSMHQAII